MSAFPKEGGPAFPFSSITFGHCAGMSLRDWYAGVAMSGLLANPRSGDQAKALCGEESVSKAAFEVADAMLDRRAAILRQESQP